MSERQLRISGTDVIAEIVAAGIRPPNYHGDPLVGNVLRALLEAVSDDPSLNTKSTLKAMIPHHLAT
jgi:ATP sulfurylase